MSLSVLSTFILIFCDLLGVGSILLMKGIYFFPICALGGAAVFFRFFKFKLKDFWVLAIGIIGLSGVVIASYLDFNNVSKYISIGLVFIQVLLFISPNETYYRSWRFVFSFFEVTLCSILQPESYMFFVFFLFAISGCVFFCLQHILESAKRFPNIHFVKIKSIAVLGILAMSATAFLLSLLIFPVLPRRNIVPSGYLKGEVGYTEKISFQNDLLFLQSQERRVVMRIFFKNGASVRSIPMGLLRGKVLDSYQGDEWSAGIRKIVPTPLEENPLNRLEFLVARDPLDTDILPVPYGQTIVNSGDTAYVHLNSSMEWISSSRRNQRANYQVLLSKSSVLPNDPPRKIHLNLVHPEKFPIILAAANRIKGKKATFQTRLNAVVALLQKFQPTLQPKIGVAAIGEHPLEVFFSKTQEGHCELFSATAALMLREMGYPTRLVSGFRISSQGSSDVLNVYNTDAHAWLEVWDQDRQSWLPIDVTPLLAIPSESFTVLNKVIDKISIFWYQYILTYEYDRSAALRPLAFLLVVFLILGLLIHFQTNLRIFGLATIARMKRKSWRERISKTFFAKQKFISGERLESIEAIYLFYRFRKAEPSQEDYHQFNLLISQAVLNTKDQYFRNGSR